MPGSSLIAMMDNMPEEYPPFVTVRDSGGTLSVNEGSFKIAIKELVPLIGHSNNYDYL